MTNVSSGDRYRAVFSGLCILAAYSMLTYDFTRNVPVGAVTDVLSGLAVIVIAVLMFPLFNSAGNRAFSVAYAASRLCEGLLMIAGGIAILSPVSEGFRGFSYEYVHIYFFISGALLFYILLKRNGLVPGFITIWGIAAAGLLCAITVLRLIGVSNIVLDALLLPMILNEIFLALWLIVKGFNIRTLEPAD